MLRISLLLLPLLFACSAGEVREKEPQKEEAPLLLRPLALLIEEHRENTTKMDGPRCPMYPSCAAWAQRAVERHGFLGLLLFVDRLFYRETGALAEKYFFAPRRLSGHLRYYDPLSDTFPLLEGKRPSLYGEDFAK